MAILLGFWDVNPLVVQPIIVFCVIAAVLGLLSLRRIRDLERRLRAVTAILKPIHEATVFCGRFDELDETIIAKLRGDADLSRAWSEWTHEMARANAQFVAFRRPEDFFACERLLRGHWINTPHADVLFGCGLSFVLFASAGYHDRELASGLWMAALAIATVWILSVVVAQRWKKSVGDLCRDYCAVLGKLVRLSKPIEIPFQLHDDLKALHESASTAAGTGLSELREEVRLLRSNLNSVTERTSKELLTHTRTVLSEALTLNLREVGSTFKEINVELNNFAAQLNPLAAQFAGTVTRTNETTLEIGATLTLVAERMQSLLAATSEAANGIETPFAAAAIHANRVGDEMAKVGNLTGKLSEAIDQVPAFIESAQEIRSVAQDAQNAATHLVNESQEHAVRIREIDVTLTTALKGLRSDFEQSAGALQNQFKAIHDGFSAFASELTPLSAQVGEIFAQANLAAEKIGVSVESTVGRIEASLVQAASGANNIKEPFEKLVLEAERVGKAMGNVDKLSNAMDKAADHLPKFTKTFEEFQKIGNTFEKICTTAREVGDKARESAIQQGERISELDAKLAQTLITLPQLFDRWSEGLKKFTAEIDRHLADIIKNLATLRGSK